MTDETRFDKKAMANMAALFEPVELTEVVPMMPGEDLQVELDRLREVLVKVVDERENLLGMHARHVSWVNGIRAWVGREADACTENVRGTKGDAFHRGAESMIRKVLDRLHQATDDEYRRGEAFTQAVRAAQDSPCEKSKRGVAIWGNGLTMVAVGFNGPPPGFACDGSDACRGACAKLCMHAEQRALAKVEHGHTDLVHVKVVDGKPVESGPPSCWQCSRAILDHDIERVWLLHKSGLVAYTGVEFHEETLRNCGLPIITSALTDTEADDG